MIVLLLGAMIGAWLRWREKAVADVAIPPALVVAFISWRRSPGKTVAPSRMADELDRGQAAGEVAVREDCGLVRSPDKVGLTDFGIDRRRLSEWRETRASRSGINTQNKIIASQ